MVWERWIRPALAAPSSFCALVVAMILAGLALDRLCNLTWQAALGVVTWAVLLAAASTLTPERRAQVAVVVVVATIAEVIGSLIWGVYEYRLGNLPLFVPAGHGLVYMCGLRLTETPLFRDRQRVLVAVAVSGALLWGVLGLTVLPRRDVAGAIGVATLVVFILASRSGAIYSGVFLTVALLEIWGTWMGTWAWAPEIPGLGVPDGNPPSGAASGYVMFDIIALALAPRVLRLARRLRDRLPPGRGPVERPAPEAAA